MLLFIFFHVFLNKKKQFSIFIVLLLIRAEIYSWMHLHHHLQSLSLSLSSRQINTGKRRCKEFHHNTLTQHPHPYDLTPRHPLLRRPWFSSSSSLCNSSLSLSLSLSLYKFLFLIYGFVSGFMFVDPDLGSCLFVL